MKYTAKQLGEALYNINNSEKDKEKNIKNFVSFLAAQGLLSHIGEIYSEYEKFRKKKDNIISVHVESAFELKKEDREGIKKLVAQKYKKIPEISEHINKKLIAGVRIQIEDFMIDTSVFGKLKNLKKLMAN